MSDRPEKWVKFDEMRSRRLAPAFVQEIVKGLWSVQELVVPKVPAHSRLYRLFNDPPPNSEPFYTGWPGDHRGWMRFESKESARDFYKFATRRISFEEFQKLPHAELSNVSIDLDDDGNFVEASAIPQPHRPDVENTGAGQSFRKDGTGSKIGK